MRPSFQSALACSMRSLREETKFHQMKRCPSSLSPPIITKCTAALALIRVAALSGTSGRPKWSKNTNRPTGGQP